MCNLIRAFFALWDTEHRSGDLLAAAEAAVEVSEPMAPLRWTEESARGYHPSSSANIPDGSAEGKVRPAPLPERAGPPTSDLLRDAATLLEEQHPCLLVGVLRSRATELEAFGDDRLDALIDDAISRHPAGRQLHPKTDK